jgi:hypothetical protein
MKDFTSVFGTFETCRWHLRTSAVGGKADRPIERPDFSVLTEPNMRFARNASDWLLRNPVAC